MLYNLKCITNDRLYNGHPIYKRTLKKNSAVGYFYPDTMVKFKNFRLYEAIDYYKLDNMKNIIYNNYPLLAMTKIEDFKSCKHVSRKRDINSMLEQLKEDNTTVLKDKEYIYEKLNCLNEYIKNKKKIV